MDMPDKDWPRLDIDSVIPYDCIRVNYALAEQFEKYYNGDINRDEYDKWRYNYPKYDETSGYVKVPSQQLSDAMVEAFKDRLKND